MLDGDTKEKVNNGNSRKGICHEPRLFECRERGRKRGKGKKERKQSVTGDMGDMDVEVEGCITSAL